MPYCMHAGGGATIHFAIGLVIIVCDKRSEDVAKWAEDRNMDLQPRIAAFAQEQFAYFAKPRQPLLFCDSFRAWLMRHWHVETSAVPCEAFRQLMHRKPGIESYAWLFYHWRAVDDDLHGPVNSEAEQFAVCLRSFLGIMNNANDDADDVYTICGLGDAPIDFAMLKEAYFARVNRRVEGEDIAAYNMDRDRLLLQRLWSLYRQHRRIVAKCNEVWRHRIHEKRLRPGGSLYEDAKRSFEERGKELLRTRSRIE